VPKRLVALLSLFVSYASGFEGTAVRTVAALLFRPGRLTRSFVSGRRIRYSHPVQVYLWCTAAFFLVHAYSPLIQLDVETGVVASSLSAIALDTDIANSTLHEARQSRSLDRFTARFDTMVTATLPLMLVVLVAASALALSALFWREPTLTHMIFALHWSAFYFALETVRQILLGQLGAWGSSISALGSLVILIYLAIAMRVVYRRSWMGSVLRAAAGVIIFALLLAGWLWSTSRLAVFLA